MFSQLINLPFSPWLIRGTGGGARVALGGAGEEPRRRLRHAAATARAVAGDGRLQGHLPGTGVPPAHRVGPKADRFINRKLGLTYEQLPGKWKPNETYLIFEYI